MCREIKLNLPGKCRPFPKLIHEIVQGPRFRFLRLRISSHAPIFFRNLNDKNLNDKNLKQRVNTTFKDI